MNAGARARTAAPTMQAMDNLKTLAKELNPVVGSAGRNTALLRETRSLLQKAVMSKVALCAKLLDSRARSSSAGKVCSLALLPMMSVTNFSMVWSQKKQNC